MTFTNLKKYVSSKEGLKQGRPPLQPNPSFQTKSNEFSGQKGHLTTAVICNLKVVSDSPRRGRLF